MKVSIVVDAKDVDGFDEDALRDSYRLGLLLEDYYGASEVGRGKYVTTDTFGHLLVQTIDIDESILCEAAKALEASKNPVYNARGAGRKKQVICIDEQYESLTWEEFEGMRESMSYQKLCDELGLYIVDYDDKGHAFEKSVHRRTLSGRVDSVRKLLSNDNYYYSAKSKFIVLINVACPSTLID